MEGGDEQVISPFHRGGYFEFCPRNYHKHAIKYQLLLETAGKAMGTTALLEGLDDSSFEDIDQGLVV